MIESLITEAEEKIEEKELCAYYFVSRAQRKEESARGLSLAGTMGYEQAGCYDCDGKNTNCRLYFHIKGLKD
jgi:hypothetical protein